MNPASELNILISCLHTNTPLCLALGRYLESEFNRSVFFVSDDSTFNTTLPNASLLLLGNVKDSLSKELETAETVSFYEYIYIRDRFLSKKLGKDAAFNLFRHWSKLIRDYLRNNKIGIVIIEGTPAYELLLENEARHCGAKIVCPAQIIVHKELNGILYSDSIWSKAYRLHKGGAEEDINHDIDHLCKIINCNDAQPGFWRKMKLIFGNRSLNSPTFYNKALEFIWGKYESFIIRFMHDDEYIECISGDIITYFLHIDPEKSVDNSGSDIWPQMEVIKNLRNQLSPSSTLIVREHPFIAGKRRLADVRAIRALQNTLYMTGRTSKRTLINNSRFIATISGSISIEAAMMGANVVVYGRPISLNHPNVQHIGNVRDFNKLGSENKLKDVANRVFLGYIEPRLDSFVFGDVYLMSEAMSLSNVINLTDAILNAERLNWQDS